ncbi:nb-arc and ankyrin domain containing protein [Beauveria brongniartii RCEF 3172]|uniref:Nb-arc and ankyrin domain containing protein n=1 Tax=Beauveria brongniartii RCEF 3172 TaxID=1081107 RepID=A0A166XER8_9HYPO|nr:nb-arc and ankyrin domain containing protein [Beauveria brongniartii RCEF 3172]
MYLGVSGTDLHELGFGQSRVALDQGKSRDWQVDVEHMIQHVRHHHAKVTILASFFFHDRGTELERTRLGFYRSILHQLLRQVPGIFHELVDKFHENKLSQGKIGTDWYWREQDLAEHLAAAISKSPALWLFVDALDEGGARTANDLVEEFTALIDQNHASNGKLHICFTCRRFPIPRITGGFELAMDERNKPDIKTFVQSGISRCSCLLRAGIADAIIDGANGIFLWARLAVDEALRLKSRERTPKQIYKAIKQMPKELEELFASILSSKADEPAESLLMMQWICFAEDAISIRELQWAIVIDADRPGVDDPKKSLDDYFDDDAYIGDDEDMERRIVVLSCGLAEVIAERVQFIHQAVKEFFLGQGLALLRSKTESENQSTVVATDEHKSGHYRLARTCIQYLCMVHRSNPGALRVGRHSIEYSKKGKIFSGHRRSAISLYTEHPPGFRCYPARRDSTPERCRCSYRSLNPKEISFALGLDFPLLLYAKYYWTTHVKASEASGTRAEDALDYPAWPPEDLFCLGTDLLKFRRNCQWISLLHLAAQYQLTAQLQAIGKRAREGQISMNELDACQRTPLSLAAMQGKPLAVQILVGGHCVDVNHEDYRGRTALWLAAAGGHADVVRILLKIPGIDVDRKDETGQTALFVAIRQHKTEVVRLLLGVADVDCRGRSGLMLLEAALVSSSDIGQLLLQTPGVDFDAQTVHRVAELLSGHRKTEQVKLLAQTAAENAHPDVVGALVDLGKAHVNSCDSCKGYDGDDERWDQDCEKRAVDDCSKFEPQGDGRIKAPDWWLALLLYA